MTTQKKYPIPSAEQEDLEESLGAVYHCFERGIRDKKSILAVLEEVVNVEAYGKLLSRGYARAPGSDVELSGEGMKLAEDVTRRHRLAERLLTDVLALSSHYVDPNACKLEHIISPEVAQSICALLGHPSECPHGSPIPRGECCREAGESVEPIISSLDKLSDGEKGRIAYLLLKNHPELHQLLALGLVPGTEFKLHQTYPTYVVESGETTIALEKDIAEKIFVRRTG